MNIKIDIVNFTNIVDKLNYPALCRPPNVSNFINVLQQDYVN
jgi:hypothetical protein